MLLMLDSAEELALEGFVRGNRSTESFGLVGKRVFAETSEDSVVGWGFPEGVGGFLGEDLSVAEDPAAGEVSAEETTEEAAAGEVFEEETTAEDSPAGYSSEPGGWGEVFSQFRKDSGVVEETPGVSGMEFEDVEEVEDEDESEDTEDEEEEFEDESEDTEDEDEFEDVEEVEDEDEFEDTEDTEEDDPTEVVEFALDDTSSGEEEVEEGSTDEYSVEEEPSGYSGGLEFEDVEEVDDDDEDTEEEYVEDSDEDTDVEEEDANTSPSSVEVVRTPKSSEVTPEEVSKPKKPAHKPRKRLSRQDASSTSQEPRPASREAKPKSQKGRLKKPSANTHTFDAPKRSPGIRRLEPIPATVREYVMANPDVCYNDVVKLYSLKQIKKELALGRIYRSGNKLGV